MESVFTIIVTYNGEKWIKKCLDSIKNQSKVIVVDNCSTDDTLAIIKDEYKEIIVLPLKKNVGFGKANNIGLQHAYKLGAIYFFLLNQDAYAAENTIENLVKCFSTEKDFAVISPIHYNGKGDALDTMFKKYASANKNLVFNTIDEVENKVYEVPFVNAAAWMFSREYLNKIGGFDPIFFHYGEDENYCQRVRYHDLKVGVCTSCSIKHDREDRVPSIKVLFTPKYFDGYKKFISLKYGNINKAFNNKEYSKECFKVFKKLLKGFLRFNGKEIKGYIKQLGLLYSIKNKILVSREINSTKGMHYIS